MRACKRNWKPCAVSWTNSLTGMKSLLRRYGREIAVRDRRIESLILALRKAEYDKEEALKKLTRYEA